MRPGIGFGARAAALTDRDKRALVLLGVAVLLILIWRWNSGGAAAPSVVTAAASAPQAEKRLARLRQLEASVPGKEDLFKIVSGELAAREKGMIVADTAQQAQAQIQQILHDVGKREGIEVRGGEFGQVKPLGTDYGEAPVSVSFDCQIEQLVNLLSALANQPQTLGTGDIRIAAGNPKEKRVVVRMTVAGVVPKKLVPQKKGMATF